MSDAQPGHAIHQIDQALVRAGNHHRSAAEQTAQQDLQAAIAADIVKCGPDHGPVRRGHGLDRPRQAFQVVHHHLGRSGGAGGEHHPFGPDRLGRCRQFVRHGCRRGDSQNPKTVEPGQGLLAIRHHRGHLTIADHDRQIVHRKIGRAQNQSPRDAVQRDQGQGRAQLIGCMHQHRLTGHRRAPARQTGSKGDIAHGHTDVRAPQRALLQAGCVPQGLTKCLHPGFELLYRRDPTRPAAGSSVTDDPAKLTLTSPALLEGSRLNRHGLRVLSGFWRRTSPALSLMFVEGPPEGLGEGFEPVLQGGAFA